jgi:hypothetical protein
VTNAEALFAIAAAVLVGMAAGALIRRRWAVLLVPTVFVMVLELARLPLIGPATAPAVGWVSHTGGSRSAPWVGSSFSGMISLRPPAAVLCPPPPV